MDQRDINVDGIGRRTCIGVTIYHETFDKFVHTMENINNELDVVKESHKKGLVADSLDHNDEEIEQNVVEEAKEETEEFFLNVLLKIKGRSKMEVYTYS